MLGDAFTGWHLVIILAIVLLLFGAPKLPALAKSVGQSMRIFRGEMKNLHDDEEKDAAAKDTASKQENTAADRDDKNLQDHKPGNPTA